MLHCKPWEVKDSSITRQLFVDPIIPGRKFYMSVSRAPDIRIEPKYLVRPLNEDHKNDLKHQIKDQGLIEPITVVEETDGTSTLLAGHHRLVALKELGASEVPCKVYVDLDETTRRLIGFMSNELRKRPPAGKRFEALSDLYQQKFEELQRKLGKIPSEEQVIGQLYYGTTKARVSEITLGITVDRLRNDPDSLVSKYDLIQNAQVPRQMIDQMVPNGRYLFFTAQNTYAALANLCRVTPVTTKETDDGHNFREYEYSNVREFFDGIVTEFIQPWITVNAVDTAVSFAKRHPFEAFSRVVALELAEMSFPVASTTTAPLYHNMDIEFDRLFKKLSRLKDNDFWTTNMISQERAVGELVNRIRYFNARGELPSF